MPRTTRLFVYGSLRRGEPSHARLGDAVFVGEARTRPELTMIDLGEYPGVVAGGATAIAGEVYEVEPATLAALDAFEGHPELYRRSTITLDDGSEVEAYLLVADAGDHRRVVGSGDWRRR